MKYFLCRLLMNEMCQHIKRNTKVLQIYNYRKYLVADETLSQDDEMFSLSEGFKSGTVNLVLCSTRGETGFHSYQAQHQVMWLMSSASPAEGGLISQTPGCAVCCWNGGLPTHLSKHCHMLLKQQFLIQGLFKVGI